MIKTTHIKTGIQLLTIDHPPGNSLNQQTKLQLGEILNKIASDQELRCIIITGTGKTFCSGDDLKEALQNADQKSGILDNLKAFGPLMDQLEALEIPVIAAINGWCVGGGLELALCCDIRLASTEARFVSAGVNVGLPASAFRLPRLIGLANAKRMLLTGQTIDARMALDFGLVTDLFSREKLLDEALKLAAVITQKAPLAIRSVKKIVNQSIDLTEEEGRNMQQEEIGRLSSSADHLEALKAFKEKKKPDFKGK